MPSFRSLLWSLLVAALAAAGPRLCAQAAKAPAGPALSREVLLADLSRQLQDYFHLAGDLRLDLSRPWTPPAARAGAPARLVITEFPSAPASSMLVRCRLEAGGAPLLDFPLVLQAQLWADVWQARDPADAGQPFNPAALDVRRADLLRDRDALPASTGGNEYVFSRPVPAGRTLVWRDLTRRPLVHKGETVDVRATDGALTVTLKALAMQNGGRGDAVLVRNPESRKEFTAVVVDEGRLQVSF
ncbi:MAG: flagellar basal body P-ring formation chaperone FlgA [Opitutaceae bacterium]|nr:flagellar basal body P-ring formation chaperone FlgA [Opitutaceae bacterium]